jgi:two-component system, OmpR family, sensor kinase
MGRLFWKFLLFISLAQLALLVGVGAVIWAEGQAFRKPPPEIDTRSRAAFLIESATDTLQYGGTAALTKLLGAPNEPLVYAVDENGQDLLGRTVPSTIVDEAHRIIEAHGDSQVVRRIASNDGHRYLVFAPLIRSDGIRPNGTRQEGAPPNGGRREWRFGSFRLPVTPMIVTLFGSLLCAGLLARYLSNPIRTLRLALDSAAKGNLQLRIGNLMDKRKDELSSLGHDFDRMAAQLHASMESQKRLLHDVSHELRSPLARLQIAVGLVRQEPGTVHETMDRIERECARIDELVGELLTLARLESGSLDNTQEVDVDITELIASVVKDARFETANNGHQITFVNHAPISVKGRPALLSRAIENIVRNALNHTPLQTTLDIDVARDNDSNIVRITFKDTGPGVPTNELVAIFQPFFRGTATASTRSNGLGLSITRQIVEVHGGSIQASNRPEGGLCVEVVLPIRRATK